MDRAETLLLHFSEVVVGEVVILSLQCLPSFSEVILICVLVWFFLLFCRMIQHFLEWNLISV